MEFKGTKGKWHTDNNTTLGGKNSIIFSEEKGVIITLNQASFDTDEEMIANALLISKAPEMLDMLIEISRRINILKTEPNGIVRDTMIYNIDIDMNIEELIKEATEL